MAAAVSQTGSASHWTTFTGRSRCKAAKSSAPQSRAWVERKLPHSGRKDLKRGGKQSGVLNVATVEAETATEAKGVDKETYIKSPITPNALEAQRIVQQLRIGSGKALDKILGPLVEQLCDQRTFGLLMKELGHRSWRATAGQVLSFLRSAGRPPDTRAHSEVLRALGRAGQSDACVALLNEMTSSGPPPDVWCYSEVLKALVGEERFDKVLAVFEEMNERGIAPSIWCYNVVVTALCKGGSIREARALLQQMRGSSVCSRTSKMAEESKADQQLAKGGRESCKGAQNRTSTRSVRLSEASTTANGGEGKSEGPADDKLLAERQRNVGAMQRGGNLAIAGKHLDFPAASNSKWTRAGATISTRGEGSTTSSGRIGVSPGRGSRITQANGSQHSKGSRTAGLQKAFQPGAGSLVHSEERFQPTDSIDRAQKGEAVERRSRSEATSDQNIGMSAQRVETTAHRVEMPAQRADMLCELDKTSARAKKAPEQSEETSSRKVETSAQNAESSAHRVEASVQAAERPAHTTETFANVKETSAQSARTSAQSAGSLAYEVETEGSAHTTSMSATEQIGLEVLRRAILGHSGAPAAEKDRGSDSPLRDLESARLGEVSIGDIAPPRGSKGLDMRSPRKGVSPDEVVLEKEAADSGSHVFVGANRVKSERQVDRCTEGGRVEEKAVRSSGQQEERGQTRDLRASQILLQNHLPSSGFATGRSRGHADISSNGHEVADDSLSSFPSAGSANASVSDWTAIDVKSGKPGMSQGSNFVKITKATHTRIGGNSTKLRWRGLKTAGNWPPPPAPDAVTYNVLIGACADQSDGWRTAVELLRCMKDDGVQPTRITYNSVLIACSRAGRWRHCLDCWNALEAANIARDDFALSCVVRALGAVKRCKKAVEMVQAAWRGAFGRECRPSVQTCNMAVTACSQQKQWQAAIAFLRWMQKETDLAPDVSTYNAAVQACLNAGEAHQALQLYSELLRLGLRPDSHSQTLYIRALTSCGRYVAALDAFWAFRGGAGVSNAITYNAAIVACGRGLLWLDAFKVFQDMDASNIAPNLVTYEALIKALCDCGEVEKARAVFQAMGPRGFKPRVRTFNNLLHGYAQENRWEEARAIFDSMLRFGVRPDTISYNILMRAYRRGGQFQAAVSIFVSMQEPDDVTFREVLTACDGGGLGAEAMWALERMDARGIEPGEFHYARALVASARGGVWEDVEELYKQMREEGMQLDGTIFMAMLARLEVEGNTERAQGLLTEWRETANDFEIGPGGYNLVLGAFGSAGKWQEALDWKELMVARGITPNVTTFSMLIGVLEKCGRWKEAMAVYGQMPMTGGVVEPTEISTAEELES